MKQLRKVYTFSFPSTVKTKMEEEKKERGEGSDFKQTCIH